MNNFPRAPLIYRHLINGRIINREVIQNDSYSTNPLFTEIMDNLEAYKQQYEMNGYKMVHTGDYVYLSENKASEDLKTDVGMHVQVLLLLIGKYLNRRNLSLTKITEISAGLTLKEISDVGKMDETKELFEKLKLKVSFAKAFDNILVKRGIFQVKTSTQCFVLSKIGVRFFDELSPLYASNTTTNQTNGNLEI